MKVRQGFISNSSSCSFLIIGFTCENADTIYFPDEQSREQARDYGELTYLEGVGYVIGKRIFNFEDGINYMDMYELEKIMDDVMKKYKVDKSEMELFYGERQC